MALKDSAVYKRLEYLFDEGSFVETNALALAGGEDSGVVTGYGYVDGSLVFAFSQNSAVSSGAVGRIHAAKICKVYENAAKVGCPVVAVFDSNGVKLDEGNEALAAYGEMMNWSNRLSGVVPQISVVLGTCSGCSAVIACGTDFVVMSKDAEFFMTPPFISKSKNDKTANAGTAENAAKSGVAAAVCDDDKAAMTKAKELLQFLPENNLAMVPVCEYSAPNQVSSNASDFSSIADADSVLELYNEFGTVKTALASIQGSTVGLISAKTDITPDDCSKTARFVRTCDAFSIPVITIVDTEGFSATAADELAGSVRDASRLAHAYAEATSPKISIITGKAIGAAYIVFAGKGSNADCVIAWKNAVISPLRSEAAVEFFHHDKLAGCQNLSEEREKLVKEYESGEASAKNAAAQGFIDHLIRPEQTRQTIIEALDMLSGKRVVNLPKKHGNMPF